MKTNYGGLKDMKGKILIFALLVLALFSVSYACAADMNDTAMAGADDSEIELDVPQDTLEKIDNEQAIESNDDGGNGTFTALQNRINGAAEDSEITLENDYAYDEGFDILGITVDKALTIDGKGHRIDGKGKSRIFNISAGNVVLKNITFTNGNVNGGSDNGNGGAIFAQGNVCIFDCNFYNNTAKFEGGAIYFKNECSAVTVSNTDFIANHADQGVGIYLQDCDNSNFTDLNFINNTGSDGLGMYIGEAYNLRFERLNFEGNHAKSAGGAIFFRGEIYSSSLSEINLTNNSARTGGAFSFRGGSYFNSFSRIRAVNNSATYGGGGVFMLVSKFEMNEFDEMTFINNSAAGDGGVFITSTVSAYNSFTNSVFESNRAGGNGGVMFLYSDTGANLFDNCSFNNNSAVNASAICFSSKLVDSTISNSNFTNNRADCAGGIFIGYDVEYTTFNNLNFINNTAQYGAGMYVQGRAFDSQLGKSNFINNNATENGGAIYINGFSGSDISGNFVNNSANRYGGAIYFNNGGRAADCTFINNTACNLNGLGKGGAIYFNAEDARVSDCTFANNAADDFGAIHLPFGMSDITGCIFLNNSASFTVIGSAWESFERVNITHNVFLDNDVAGNIIGFAYLEKLTADFNWFGNTADDYDSGSYPTTENITAWMFLNVTAGSDSISVFDTTDIVFKLYLYNKTSQIISGYDNSRFKSVNLTINATNGFVSTDIAKLGEIIKYNATRGGTGKITASIGDVACSVEINNVKVNLAMKINPQEVYYSNNAILALDYNSTATGTVNITLKGRNNTYTFQNVELNSTVSLGKISPGEYNVTVSYSGDGAYLPCNAVGNLTVLPIVDLSVTMTCDKEVYLLGDICFCTITVHNAANGTNATNVKLGDFFKGFSYVASLTYNGTYHPNGTWEIGFMPNGTDATLIICYKAVNLTEGTLHRVLVLCNEKDWNFTNNIAEKAVAVKLKTEIAANAVTTTYNVNKNLVITLKDSQGNPLTGVKISVDLNGARTYVTDKNGQVKVPTGALVPKTYTAKITFSGSGIYLASAKSVKVTVKKAKPKIKAKKKTYRAKSKTKKFTITLKDNKGKPIKKAKVTLKVKKIKKNSKKKKSKSKSKKKKKNTVKTNSKGKATFKIDKNKKGKYQAIIKYKGNKYYKSVTKKVKIIIK